MKNIIKALKISHVMDLKSTPMKKKLRQAAITVLRLVMLISIGYIIIYPLLQMLSTAVKDKTAFFDAAKVWIPSKFNIAYNFGTAFKAVKYWDGIKSTFINQILSALIEIITCSIAAYGFARFKFKFKGFFTACLFITILIPEAMIIIPRVTSYAHLDFMGIFGLIDKITGIDLRPNIVGTSAAFWLPSVFAMGLRSGILIYIYIQFFKGLPFELEEAAWVDGAGPIRTFVSIALPSSGVVFTTVAVFSIIWHWNDTLLSSMYMQSEFPLAVNISRIESALSSMSLYTTTNVEAQAIMMAACVIFLIPPLIFYMIMQKRFIESIDRVGITG